MLGTGLTTPGRGTGSGGSWGGRRGTAEDLAWGRQGVLEGLPACCSPCLGAVLAGSWGGAGRGGRRAERGTAQLEEALSNCA